MFSFGRENTGLVAKWWRNVDKQILFLFKKCQKKNCKGICYW